MKHSVRRSYTYSYAI